ncbi:thrombospondin type 1 domain-containing protein [Ditylenchus destructor]|uniref:Thrombospondin type 1 domain-containing protein n=1 Tax=Ditylenchus destructor TaxID=166010 RepID=A0AAD4R7Y1_9BILA|nr:thrombospondin type 1 domain-containing protein [Ditylenchus destructor]
MTLLQNVNSTKCHKNDQKMSFKKPAWGLAHSFSPHCFPVCNFTFIALLLMCFCRESAAGCYQQRLCCAGRNNSCKSHDDSPTSKTRRSVRLFQMRQGEQFPPVFTRRDEKIGRLIMPDLIELDGMGLNYANKFGHNEFLWTHESLELSEWDTTKQSDEHHLLIFGAEQEESLPERTLFRHKGRPIIRYSTLNKYLPLKVGKVKRIAIPTTSTVEVEQPQVVVYLSEPTDCYCDEACTSLSDCCSDYTFVCPPRDCHVSHWSGWSVCQAEGQLCGEGNQKRARVVLNFPSNGGEKCPEKLTESRTCFKQCANDTIYRPYPYPGYTYHFDITTVALLLDYQYNSTRTGKGLSPEMIARRNDRKHIYYCVQYELGWVNRNCVEKEWKSKLYRKNTICAECQPEAQLHRNNARCASDLEDGEKGFWKLIGPPSCTGIWRRINRTDHCKCYDKYPTLDPFLMV